ncbi:hypothetical protein BOTCAL_0521g00100 [Botryotinia calthae]|uniref:Uncharacterized protein n=1 Tax=Botryotinia calthae TaxID=38488 RepID=A0A4Y8CKT5_9HELO|nr:hypothetical protein BOTCAL_0521g00100 [Botryotinia calthae]
MNIYYSRNKEVSIARFLSQRENEILAEKRQAQMNKEQAKKAKKAMEMRRMLKTLNKEAEADAREGWKAWGRSREELRQVKVLEQERALSREELLIEENI